ncbi:MAG TPA: hypothetical protein VNT26_15120, partial [Candidatus Sulfotelmatobacter sp.]|nr:hypothetical protein [Candidatus Sulfotelmatobacter sp.]
VIRNANIEFTGGGKAEQGHQPVRGPGVDARPLPAWGIYARNVQQLTCEDVRLSLAREDLRPVVLAENVGGLNLDNFKFSPVAGVAEPLVTTNVGQVNLRQTELKR